AGPVVQVQVVVVGPLALVDEQPERHGECLLAGAADPEIALALLVHRDQTFLEHARSQHQIVDLETALGGEPACRGGDGSRPERRWCGGRHGATPTSYRKTRSV